MGQDTRKATSWGHREKRCCRDKFVQWLDTRGKRPPWDFIGNTNSTRWFNPNCLAFECELHRRCNCSWRSSENPENGDGCLAMEGRLGSFCDGAAEASERHRKLLVPPTEASEESPLSFVNGWKAQEGSWIARGKASSPREQSQRKPPCAKREVDAKQ